MRLTFQARSPGIGLVAGAFVCAAGCGWVAGLSDHSLAEGTGPVADAAPEVDSQSPVDDAADVEQADSPEEPPVDSPGDDATDSQDGLEGSTLSCEDATAGDTGCSFGLADCDQQAGNGCEVDLQSDAAHCGRCGHACGGGACTDGECEAYVALTGLGELSAIALWDDQIYWGDSTTSTIQFAPKAGGAAQQFAPSEGVLWALGADDSGLYWSRPGAGDWVLRAKPWSGGVPVTFATTAPNVEVLLFDSTHVYWVEPGSQSSIRRKLKGSTDTPTLIAANQVDVAGAAVDAQFVYFSSGSGASGSIRRVPKTGQNATPDVLASGIQDPEGVAVLDDTLYFTTDTEGKVYSLPKSGGTPVKLADGSPGLDRILMDDQFLFWRNKNGGVYKMSRCPGSAPLELRGGVATGLALDSDALFFGTGTEGEIWRAVR